ncbi:outer membrane lipoprotein-sorting protein [Chitiniphilus purpureus]|uniref:Outer membrane lipoprotein-sorting protein n=1 Tax=Chitiniphilus purpureus TaxID=2981137 RepID=A0ABY6DPD6_9NEIS|nr:outer membrane lipoprotein-sorting protein [Chitiniphilus sp. CD1]UXY15887.1 outer membrane lipoprotein-sorting protein [Chitiniphilus sp. CD1]
MTNITHTAELSAPACDADANGPRLLERYVTWVVDYRKWVIGCVVLLTVFFGLFAAKQQVVINPAAVVPQGHPYIKATNAIEKIFGSKYLVVIGVTPRQGDALQPAVLDTVRRITDQLYAAPTVSKQTLLSLTSRQAKRIRGTADGFEAKPLIDTGPTARVDRTALKQAIEANPVYRDTVISQDWRTATIMLELKENPNGFGAMLADVHRILGQEQQAGLQVTVSGNPVFLHQAEIFAERINWLFPIAVLVIGLLHFEAFRTRQGLILPLVTALLSVVWGVGVMGLMRIPMDIFNSPTPILILAVAAGHAVQLLKRYYERFIELVDDQGVEPALANRLATIQSLVAVGPVLVIAGGVAALGFFSLVVFEVETVRAFGIFTGIGILTAVMLEFTFTPAVRASLRAPSADQIRTESRVRFWDRLSAGIAQSVRTAGGRTAILAGTALLVAIAIAGWPRVQIDNASKTFFSPSLPIQQDDQQLNRQTGGTNVLYLMVDTGREDGIKDPKVLAAMHALQLEAAKRPHVGKTLSIYDFLQRMHEAASGESRTAGPLPADRNLIAQYLFLYAMSGDPEDFSAHVDYGYQRAKIAVMLRTNSNAEIDQLVRDLKREAGRLFPRGVSVSFGGEVAQTLAVTDVMVHSKLLNIVQILAVIFAVSAIAFRSLVAGALVLAPLLVVLALVFGAMGYFGVPLNIPNSLISAMAVGIGADYAIYLIYRISEFVSQGQSLNAAVNQAIKTAGKACLFVATAVAGGYAVLLFSYDYKVHMWLSSFIVLAMLASVLTALTLIPSAILIFKPRFVLARRSGDRGAILLIILATIGFLTYSQIAWSAPDAAQIMERSAAATRFSTSNSSAEFVLESKDGGKRTRKASMTSKLQDNGTDTMRLVRFEAPADIKGTATLLIEKRAADDDMWVYLPAMKRVRRLVASNKKDSFIGTDFSYGDVMGHKVGDWKHTLLSEQTKDGIAYFVIESIPASDATRADSGYGKRVSWVRKDNWVAALVETQDTGGQPYKRFVFSDIQKVDAANNKWQPMKAVGSNLQSGHTTTITFASFKVGEPVAETTFSANNLATH